MFWKLEGCTTQNIAFKCNPSKTEIIHFSSRFSPPEPIASIKVGHHNIQPTSVIKNLGVTLDSHLTFVPHVNNICRALSRSFHYIGRIRKHLSQADTERIVHAFVLSKLDYCNSLLYGLPSREIEKLQRLQNTAARLTVCMKKTDHITPVLIKLHWLPVNDRITFKSLLLSTLVRTNLLMALPRCILMNCCIITLPAVLFVPAAVTPTSLLFRRLLQLPTMIDLLRQLLQSYGISYRLPLDKATVLIVLKGR